MAELPILILPKIPTCIDITWPVHEEPKITTGGKKLIIKVNHIIGFYREGGETVDSHIYRGRF